MLRPPVRNMCMDVLEDLYQNRMYQVSPLTLMLTQLLRQRSPRPGTEALAKMEARGACYYRQRAEQYRPQWKRCHYSGPKKQRHTGQLIIALPFLVVCHDTGRTGEALYHFSFTVLPVLLFLSRCLPLPPFYFLYRSLGNCFSKSMVRSYIDLMSVGPRGEMWRTKPVDTLLFSSFSSIYSPEV